MYQRCGTIRVDARAGMRSYSLFTVVFVAVWETSDGFPRTQVIRCESGDRRQRGRCRIHTVRPMITVRSLFFLVLAALGLEGEPAHAAGNPDKCAVPDATQAFEFVSGQNTLRGFIDLPPGPGPHPVILIIHGSGTTDVFHASTVYNGLYAELRQTFREAGFATAVWDKAGNGCSTGSYPH